MKRLACILLLLTSVAVSAQQTRSLVGAWQTDTADGRMVMICSEKIFSVGVYDKATGAFKGTCGGTYKVDGDQFIEKHEFNTMKPDMIGKEVKSGVELQGSQIVFNEPDGKQEWKRLDDGKPGALAGAWLITGRLNGNEMSKLTPGERRTMKILSGTKFQWIAYNVDTKEFFGTGGGSYTTENGKYVETIEFFSRDNSRVGKSLSFEFSIDENGN